MESNTTQLPSVSNQPPNMESNLTQPPSLQHLVKESLNSFRKNHIFIKCSGIKQKDLVDVLRVQLAEDIDSLFFSFRRDEIHIYGDLETLTNIYNRHLIKKIEIGTKKLSFIFYKGNQPTPFRVRFSGIGFPQIANWEKCLNVKLHREFRHGVLTTNHIANFETLSNDLKKALIDDRLRNVVQAVNFCPTCLEFLSTKPVDHVCIKLPPSSTSNPTHSPTPSVRKIVSTQLINLRIVEDSSPTTSSSPSTTPPSQMNPLKEATSSQTANAAVATAQHTPGAGRQVDTASSSSNSRHSDLRTSVDNNSTVNTSRQENSINPSPSSSKQRSSPHQSSPPKEIKLQFKGLSQKTIKTFFQQEEHQQILEKFDKFQLLLWNYKGAELTIRGDKHHLDLFLHHFRSFSIGNRDLHFCWVFP